MGFLIILKTSLRHTNKYKVNFLNPKLSSGSIFPDDDTPRNFEESPNDDKAALSNEDRHAMEVVEHIIKRVDDLKFQIAIPLRHISLNLLDNVLVARDRLQT